MFQFMRLKVRGRTIEFPRRPLIMGIVHLCADSFSGGGIVDADSAVEHARDLIGQGADIIDIGVESARANHGAMSEADEAERLRSFMKQFRDWNAGVERKPADDEQVFPPLLAIHTWRPEVARGALAMGADILNDIGGQSASGNAGICAGYGAALVVMHGASEPQALHRHVHCGDIMAELDAFFQEKMDLARSAGLDEEAVILDPGIDLSKQHGDALSIYREVGKLNRFGRPILLPAVIGGALALPEPAVRDAAAAAGIVAGILRGVLIFRVHNVRAAIYTLKSVMAVENAEACGFEI